MDKQVTAARKKTVVLLRHIGIGDLIWHLPYIRAIAADSLDGKVSVIAAPTTRAPEILAAENCIDEVILYDRNPRRGEKRKGLHGGIRGMFRFAREIEKYRFERIYIFSRRYHHSLVAWLAGIPMRAGFGTNLRQRLFLNQQPYIVKYKGVGVEVFEDATSLAVAHGFVDKRVVPKMKVPEVDLAFGRQAVAGLPHPVVGFAIGTSEVHKHWGDEKYGALADTLIERGYSVVLLGGPGEAASAQRILDCVSAERRGGIRGLTKNTILQTAGVLRAVDCCVGNDTGVLNMAAATDKPSICLLGKRPLLLHDPLIHCLNHATLDRITVDDVFAAVRKTSPAASNAE